MDPITHHQNFVNEVLDKKLKSGKLKRLYIAEILQAFGEVTKKKEKAKILVNNAQPALLELLRLTYDPNISYDLTKKEVESIEYIEMDIPDYDLAPATIFTEIRRLKLFTSESPTPLTVDKQKQMLSNLFSAMHEDDINLIYGMFGKKLPVAGLTEKFVRECFPDLLSKKEGE